MGLIGGQGLRLKIVALSVALVVVLAVVGIAGFFFLQSRAVDHYFVAGNAHLDKSLLKLDRIMDDLGKVRVDTDPVALSVEAGRIRPRVPAARSQIKAAEKDFRRMRKAAYASWETKTADLLLDGAREARAGTTDIESGLRKLSGMAKILVKIEEASKDYNEAFVKTNAAITAGNEDKFDEAKQDAADAGRLFDESQKLLTKAAKVFNDQKLDALIPALSKGREWAITAEKMADAGAADQISTYNKLVKTSNKLSEEVADIGRSQVLGNTRGWFNGKLDKLNDSMAGHFDKADELREKALKLWKKNT